jgi:hypothetical protein
MKSVSDLFSRIEKSGGLVTVSMREMKQLYDATRLKSGVRESIEDDLKENGIGHIPPEIPNSEHAEIRLYVRGTRIGRFIQALLQPNTETDKEIVEKLADPARDALVRAADEIISIATSLKQNN